jgi:DNA-binding GntR family transcriptional regulator
MAIRILLEVPAAHRAAEHMDDDAIEELDSTLKAMVQAANASDETMTMKHDRCFHKLISLGSGNARLANYVDSLRDLVLRRGLLTAGRSRSLRAIVDEHTAILEAIANREAEAAATSMKQHLVTTAMLLLRQESGEQWSAEHGRNFGEWERLVLGSLSEPEGSRGPRGA